MWADHCIDINNVALFFNLIHNLIHRTTRNHKKEMTQVHEKFHI